MIVSGVASKSPPASEKAGRVLNPGCCRRPALRKTWTSGDGVFPAALTIPRALIVPDTAAGVGND